MSRSKWGVLVLLGVALALFFALDLRQYLTLDLFADLYRENPGTTRLLYFLVYVAVTAFSLPGAAVMTIVGGAVFGLWEGVVLVSFASTIGATLAFLISRTLLRDWVQQRFGTYLESINQGIKREGSFYLFTLRLIPAVPFFVINLVMGLTPMKVWRFFWVSQLGMLAGTLVYVNAGAQLGQVEELSVQGVMTPGLLASFLVLAFFPWMARALLGRVRQRALYRSYPRPERFDTNLVVIGAGSAGLVSSYIAAAVKARVSLVEKERMGGDCLNTGCVPSKALIRSARIKHYADNAAHYGLKVNSVAVDFPAVMERVQRVISKIEPHDSIERYSALGVDCVSGQATIKSPWQVEVNGTTINTRNIVIATGARPFVPPIPGLDTVGYLTSDTIWGLREQPGRLLVIGGGPIGCELAQAFSRLGSCVIQLDMASRIMPREDEDVSALVAERFVAEGVDLRVDHKPLSFGCDERGKWLVAEHRGEEVRIEFDQLLMAVGRKANTSGFGLENLDIPLTRQGTLEVNEYLQTRYPNIFACGDVAGPYQFTHAASHQAWYATVNALFGRWWKFKVDYSVIPWATFCDPEVARVGLNEQEARERGVSYEVTRYDISDLDRAIADEAAYGFIKVLTVPGRDRILGVTIVGYHAAELITEYVSAMKQRIGLNKILGTIHIYPTLSESNKFVAGEWKRAHAPQRLLEWVERYHRRQRGG
ncbi:FAD-dependent oxidoreductase [Aestuariirhabdus litorea]|uniref:Pyridine nucleotide-disulfide oxidoreductase n=1 Tax=Aestuariirhabdus litorea TaxID=2528527 RepID=A0A3P3VJU0_9GAMM|nr:FAD-dependent oxidoreductase [Aestuariirhabdus litorea]RRJ82980.1 pyridine nucleotide-disulfide oxidoreductase [Aestuariirhabdus litorea]RWW93140.1 pyridine nucleotide-disulfide oxidoreductase [Endozoicomonadaceae bacterium GTF-13]